MSLQDLPTLNAWLNSAACLLLIFGYRAIKRGHRQRHRNLMICALVVSALFLTSYLTYHFHFGHKVFPELGWIKSLYLAILIPHVILAVVMVPFILLTFYFAFSRQWGRHRWLARITLPIWLVVSVSGIVVYAFLALFYF